MQISQTYIYDYYPFGMLMPGRSYSSTAYKYGFNKGSEKDDEIAGLGNHFSTFFREGDTRLATWWGVDPKAGEQAWQSPYSFMDGNPILKNDPFGDKVPITGKKKAISAFLKELKNGSGNKYKLDNNNRLNIQIKRFQIYSHLKLNPCSNWQNQ